MKVIEIKNILNNLDKDGVPFAKGGIIKRSNIYKLQ